MAGTGFEAASPAVELQVGTLLCGRYRLLGELGRGGMARVFRARDERIGRDVAVKTLAPELALDRHAFERFQDEARAIGRLVHPHIAPLFDVGAYQGQPFMVLQLVEGPSLEELLRAG